MNMPSWYILIFYPMGALLTLAAVALGAYVVFKTKRDPSESLFKLREPKGEVFNIEEEWEKKMPDMEPPKIPPATAAAALRFRGQMEEEKMPTPNIVENMGEENES